MDDAVTVTREVRRRSCKFRSRLSMGEVVEGRHAVRLGPDAHRAGARDVIVLLLDVSLAIQEHLDPLAGKLDAQRVPGVRGNRRVDILDRVAPPAGGGIERDVIFERVRAGDVVVVAVLPAPHYSARLVLAAFFRLELYLDETVGQRRSLLHAPRKRPFAALPQHVRRARRGSIRRHGPHRATPARDSACPAVGQRAGPILVEIVGFGERGARREDCQCGHYDSFHDLLSWEKLLHRYAAGFHVCTSSCPSLHQAYSASYSTIPCFSISWSSGKIRERPSDIAARPGAWGASSSFAVSAPRTINARRSSAGSAPS